MVHLVKKVKKGNTYLYLAERGRVDGKSKQLWQVYLGPEKRFKESTELVLKPGFQTESIQFGLIAALLHIAQKLQLTSIIDQVTKKRNQGLGVGDHVLIAAINRCLAPCSKTQIREWLDTTILKKFYPSLDVQVDASAYWTHFRYLTDENIELIENELARVVKDTFGIKFDDLSFDPTNFFTYINPRQENQELAEHGHSKEGRATLNIINMSLFCALDGGIPLLHLVYPGNVQDASHFRDGALPRLKQRLEELNIPAATVTLIFDKGNLSEEAFEIIDALKCKYICSDRPSSHKTLLNIKPTEFEMHELPNGKKIGVKEFHDEKYGRARRFIAIFNPNEAKWKQETLATKMEAKIAEISEYFSTRVVFSPGEKRKGQGDKWRTRTNVEAKVKELIGSRFKDMIHVTITGPDEIPLADGGRFDVVVSTEKEAIEAENLELGKSFLMTNRDDLALHDIVWVYRQQYLTERAFKWLKSPDFVSVKPMFHWVDSSIKGHLFSCFIALLLLTLLVRELSTSGVKTSIYKAVKHLKAINVTRITIPGRKEPIDQLDKLSPESQQLLDALDLGKFL
nr:IS1634 family transposase [Candidatus Sigynarchaeum springense]